MADTRKFILGKNCKLYLNPTPLEAVATMAEEGWVEQKRSRDVSVNRTKDKADATSRENNGYKQQPGTLKQGTITTEVCFQPSDSLIDTLQDAYENDTEIAAAALTGDKAPAAGLITQGLSGNFTVNDFSMTQNLGDVVKYNLTLDASTYTKWLKITGAGA